VCRAWLLWGNCPRIAQCTWHHPPVCLRVGPALQSSGFGAETTPLNPNAPLCAQVFSTENGAKAGRQLLSILGTNECEEQGGNYCNDEQKELEKCGALLPWQPRPALKGIKFGDFSLEESNTCSMASPMDLNVSLEDMSDMQGPWDQFEVNEVRFGVKSSFLKDLSQYTTKLDTSKIPTGAKLEADRIASEIENEQKARVRDSDGYNCVAAVDGDIDEETKFSAVSHRIVQMQ